MFSFRSGPVFLVALALGCTAPNPNTVVDAPPEADASQSEGAPDAQQPDAPKRDAPAPDALAPDAPAPDAPAPDVDASVDAAVVDAFVCTADQLIRCDGDDAVFCNATGDGERTETCDLGCNAVAGRCNDVAPSNGLGPYLDMAATEDDLVLTDGASISTADGSVTNGDGSAVVLKSVVQGQSNGLDIRVFIVGSLTIQGAVSITGAPAIAFVSDGDIEVRGVARVRAGRDHDTACEGSLATCDSGICGGGGGAGFGTIGGDGGDFAFGGHLGRGGQRGGTSGNAQLVPLRGGCGIEGAGTPPGGAIQLVSRTAIKFASGGFLDLNGDGGAGFLINLGGTSGGAALLEAPRVEIANGSGIAANGGGGAGPCAGTDGDPGQLSTDPAPGGSCAAGSGGRGGARSASPKGGTRVTSGDANGGTGGGGAAGRIRINVAGDGFAPLAGAVVSPVPSIGVLATR